MLTLFARRGDLDIADWQLLREANQPPFRDEPLPQPPPAEPWPHLPRPACSRRFREKKPTIGRECKE